MLLSFNVRIGNVVNVILSGRDISVVILFPVVERDDCGEFMDSSFFPFSLMLFEDIMDDGRSVFLFSVNEIVESFVFIDFRLFILGDVSDVKEFCDSVFVVDVVIVYFCSVNSMVDFEVDSDFGL